MKLYSPLQKIWKKLGISILAFSLAVSFLAAPITAQAGGTVDLMQEMENRKALPIQSNEIENWPQGPQVGAQSAIVMEANTGTILYSKNIHEPLYPASTTKILTCLVASEHSTLEEMVSFSHEAVFSLEYGSSNMGMDVGQSITMEEALYGILVGSANEVANAVAEHIGGSIEGFAAMMNQKAEQLGCMNSHFVNPSGLHDDNHYTSAYDLAVIARSFYQNELLAKMSGTPTRHFKPTETQPDDFILRTHHKLVTNEYPFEGIIGGKTGYTSTSRQTLVTCAERNGMKLVCVVMKEESPNQFTDTINLLNYGFSNFSMVNVSENETRYNIDHADFFQTNNDIFGSSKPILTLDQKSCIVLPRTASFEDATSSISYEVEKERQIARIDYTYQGVYIGNAAIHLVENTVSPYDFEKISETEAETGEEAESGINTRNNQETDNSTITEAAPEISTKKEAEQEPIFINIKKVLLLILSVAGFLILLFFGKALIQSYSFSSKNSRERRKQQRRGVSRRRYRRRPLSTEVPRYRPSSSEDKPRKYIPVEEDEEDEEEMDIFF
ncbi:MAG: D-alanyl-D-alanine carboxypeptidase [Lachnospiraceae bacterium]|nr:D-alanyl-D-alanine carboxypeptidase [Lachnospiraceae bacterium]